MNLNPTTPQIQGQEHYLTVVLGEGNFFPELLQQPEVSSN
jgi:hypothetical protein